MNTKLKCLNQKGFALISSIAFLPFLIAVIVVFSYIGKHLLTQSQALHQCRQQLINTQSKIGVQLEKLLALNSKAQRLRKQRKSARSALVLSFVSSPQLILITKAALKVIAIKQIQLRYQQQKIINKMRSIWARGERNLRRSLKSIGAKNISFNRPKPAIVPVPPTSLSPSYRILPGLTYLQKQKASWEISPPYQKSLFLSKGFKWSSSCAASIYRVKKKWRSRLVVAK